MKTLYIVPDWTPFPESEYGGVHVLIASSNKEALDMLKPNKGLKVACKRAISRAERVPVFPDEPSRVVKRFVT